MRNVGVFFVVTLTLLMACGPGRGPDVSDEPAPTVMRRAIELYPSAAEVRLFINEESIWFDADGEPGTGSYPSTGIVLAHDEVAVLQRSFFETAPPDTVAACCVPRHAFVFYDEQGQRLGVLRVCFECSCARIHDGRRLDEGRNTGWIDWDMRAIGEIVHAHGQQTIFEN